VQNAGLSCAKKKAFTRNACTYITPSYNPHTVHTTLPPVHTRPPPSTIPPSSIPHHLTLKPTPISLRAPHPSSSPRLSSPPSYQCPNDISPLPTTHIHTLPHFPLYTYVLSRTQTPFYHPPPLHQYPTPKSTPISLYPCVHPIPLPSSPHLASPLLPTASVQITSQSSIPKSYHLQTWKYKNNPTQPNPTQTCRSETNPKPSSANQPTT